jgi:hypothetical protein
MPRYPLLSEPLDPGLTTIPAWAQSINRSPAYIQGYWARLEDWPAPVGELPPKGRDRRGRGRHVYRLADLEAIRNAHPEMRPENRSQPIETTLDPEVRVTLGFFAGVAGVARKTVTQARENPGFPKPGTDGKYRLGDLLDYWPTRPGKRGKARASGAN